MSAPRVLVTGARGFVGTHLCAHLERSGFAVTRVSRQAQGDGFLRVPSLCDAAAVRSAMRGAEAVVHLAARVHVMDDRALDPLAEFRSANVETTRTLAGAAKEEGVRAFVFISSVKAVSEGSDAQLDSTTVPHPGDPYGRSKREAEEVLEALAPSGGLDVSIVRAPLVYGPGVRANMLRLFKLVDRGIPLPFGGLRNRRSLVSAGNLAAAIAGLLRHPMPAGARAYYASDGEDVSTPELVRAIARSLGRRARLIAVPEWMFRFAGSAGDLLPRRIRGPLSSATVDRLVGSLFVDSAPLYARAGLAPPFRLEEAFADTARWYRAGART